MQKFLSFSVFVSSPIFLSLLFSLALSLPLFPASSHSCLLACALSRSPGFGITRTRYSGKICNQKAQITRKGVYNLLFGIPLFSFWKWSGHFQKEAHEYSSPPNNDQKIQPTTHLKFSLHLVPVGVHCRKRPIYTIRDLSCIKRPIVHSCVWLHVSPPRAMNWIVMLHKVRCYFAQLHLTSYLHWTSYLHSSPGNVLLPFGSWRLNGSKKINLATVVLRKWISQHGSVIQRVLFLIYCTRLCVHLPVRVIQSNANNGGLWRSKDAATSTILCFYETPVVTNRLKVHRSNSERVFQCCGTGGL